MLLYLIIPAEVNSAQCFPTYYAVSSPPECKTYTRLMRKRKMKKKVLAWVKLSTKRELLIRQRCWLVTWSLSLFLPFHDPSFVHCNFLYFSFYLLGLYSSLFVSFLPRWWRHACNSHPRRHPPSRKGQNNPPTFTGSLFTKSLSFTRWITTNTQSICHWHYWLLLVVMLLLLVTLTNI